MQEVTYERILPTHNAADVPGSTEFNFIVPPRTDYFTRFLNPPPVLNHLFLKMCFVCSFNSDYQMVIDAQVLLTVSEIVVPPIVQPPAQQELLYPPRHQITLPLNNLNFIFDNIEVAFNQTSKLNMDK